MTNKNSGPKQSSKGNFKPNRPTKTQNKGQQKHHTELGESSAEVIAEIKEKYGEGTVELLVETLMLSKTYSGPLPQADEFRKYGEVLPGAPDRILLMAEKEQEKEIQLQIESNKAGILLAKRAQFYFSVYVFLSIGAAIAFVILDKVIPASVSVIFGALGFVKPVYDTISSMVHKRRTDRD